MNSKKRNNVPIGFVSIDRELYQIEYLPEPRMDTHFDRIFCLISKLFEIERAVSMVS